MIPSPARSRSSPRFTASPPPQAASLSRPCDMAVAAEGTRFGVNGVNIGLFCSTPDGGAVPATCRAKIAFEMLTTGAVHRRRTARAEVGLVNRVGARDAGCSVPRHSGAGRSRRREAHRRRQDRQARLLRPDRACPVADAYDHAAGVMVENMLWRDTEEGIGAFLGKAPARLGVTPSTCQSAARDAVFCTSGIRLEYVWNTYGIRSEYLYFWPSH
jgi:enoyl-CoA hydratase/carnithine racemase